MARTETSAERSSGTSETVAVLGAGGTMGFAMARNIARAGIAVRAWNRTRGKAEPLAADGAYIADTPADAAAGAGIVLTMLARPCLCRGRSVGRLASARSVSYTHLTLPTN